MGQESSLFFCVTLSSALWVKLVSSWTVQERKLARKSIMQAELSWNTVKNIPVSGWRETSAIAGAILVNKAVCAS